MKTQMVRLIALGRQGSRQVYGTRRLTAGDEFEMRRDVADILIRTGRATLAAEGSRPPGNPPPPPVRDEAPEPAVIAAVERNESLRAEAERLGIEVDGRWGTVRLQQEIAKARGT
jgi:hypothetical protein